MQHKHAAEPSAPASRARAPDDTSGSTTALAQDARAPARSISPTELVSLNDRRPPPCPCQCRAAAANRHGERSTSPRGNAAMKLPPISPSKTPIQLISLTLSACSEARPHSGLPHDAGSFRSFAPTRTYPGVISRSYKFSDDILHDGILTDPLLLEA
ncbi:hypothetical protein EJB05_57423, partial [Eragrostis curvula]